MILVVGAAGQVGQELLKILSYKGVRFRALVRNEKNGAIVEKLGAKVSLGDLGKPETYGKVLDAGIKKIFLLSTPGPDFVRNETNMIEAAKKSGVERIVKISAFGAADGPVKILKDHYLVEEELKKSGIPWTILRPNFYVQNLAGFLDDIRKEGIIRAPMKEGKISMVHIRNVGAVGVSAIIYDGHEGKTYDITGPEPLSFGDVARILGEAYKKPIEFHPMTIEEFRASGDGSYIEDMAKMYELFEKGQASEVSDTVKTVGATTPLNLSDYAIELFSQS